MQANTISNRPMTDQGAESGQNNRAKAMIRKKVLIVMRFIWNDRKTAIFSAVL